MAKKSAQRSAGGGSGKPRTPAGLRAQLRRTDRELVKLLNLHAKLHQQLVRLEPADENAPPPSGVQPGEFDELLAATTGPLSERSLRAVLRELTSGTSSLLRTTTVAFLGPTYSYSHLATLARFGQSVELLPVVSIAAVFEEVNRQHAEFGVVPVENSTDGRIADTLDMFTRLRVRICGEVPMHIHHSLLGRCARNEVKEVYSKPQALSQCRNWLNKHLPTVRMVEVTSTSVAAQLANEKPGAAAIASVEAGRHYGLDALAENIEDNPMNITRFLVIGQQSAERTGSDKMSAMFEVEHKPGALADAMNVFKRNRLNLTWIESFPIARPEGGYLFFIELEGHERDVRVRRALESLERKAVRLEVLGSYPRNTTVN